MRPNATEAPGAPRFPHLPKSGKCGPHTHRKALAGLGKDHNRCARLATRPVPCIFTLPNLGGESGKFDQQTTLRWPTNCRHGHLCRFGRRSALGALFLLRNLTLGDRVDSDSTPPCWGCQVTNPISCILHPTLRNQESKHRDGVGRLAARNPWPVARVNHWRKRQIPSHKYQSGAQRVRSDDRAAETTLSGLYARGFERAMPVVGARMWKAVDWEEKGGGNPRFFCSLAGEARRDTPSPAQAASGG